MRTFIIVNALAMWLMCNVCGADQLQAYITDKVEPLSGKSCTKRDGVATESQCGDSVNLDIKYNFKRNSKTYGEQTGSTNEPTLQLVTFDAGGTLYMYPYYGQGWFECWNRAVDVTLSPSGGVLRMYPDNPNEYHTNWSSFNTGNGYALTYANGTYTLKDTTNNIIVSHTKRIPVCSNKPTINEFVDIMRGRTSSQNLGAQSTLLNEQVVYAPPMTRNIPTASLEAMDWKDNIVLFTSKKAPDEIVMNPHMHPCEEMRMSQINIVPPSKKMMVGGVVNAQNGQTELTETYFSSRTGQLGLNLIVTYHSKSSIDGLFGRGQRSDYDVNLIKDYLGNITVYDNLGMAIYFKINKDGNYKSIINGYYLKKTGDTWSFMNKHGYQIIYNLEGRMISAIDRRGNTIKVTYGLPNNFGKSTIYVEDNKGQRVTMLNNKGKISEVVYPDGVSKWRFMYVSGRLTRATDPDNDSVGYDYDFKTKMISKRTDYNRKSVEIKYDVNGNAVSVSNQNILNSKMTLSYAPNVTTITNVAGVAKTIGFNTCGMAESVNGIKTKEWDLQLNRTIFIDKNGGKWTLKYDDMNNLTKAIDPTGKSYSYSYDPVYNLIKEIRDDVSLKTTTFNYSSSGDIVNVSESNGITRVWSGDVNAPTLSVNYPLDAHDTLDVAGFFDPSPASDAANAFLYAHEGEWGNMTISIAGTVPYFGDAFKFLKWTKKTTTLSSGIGVKFDRFRRGLQRGVDPMSLKPTKPLYSLDPKQVEIVKKNNGEHVIFVDKDGYVDDGHHTMLIAIQEKKTVDVMVIDNSPIKLEWLE